MKLVIGILVLFMAFTGATAQAEMLSGREIRAAVSGARLVGVNKLDSPYTLLMRPNGTMKGVLGKKKQFNDRGRWWVKGDKLCMHWELWLLGTPTCYDIDLEGDQITRVNKAESVFIRSTLMR